MGYLSLDQWAIERDLLDAEALRGSVKPGADWWSQMEAKRAYERQLEALAAYDVMLREGAERGPSEEQVRQGVSSILDVIPGVGDVKSGVEAWTGKDPVTGDKLPGWARGLAALGALPLVPSLVYAGKMARGAKVPKGGVAKTLESLADADLVEVTGKGDEVRKWVPKGEVEGTGTDLGQWWRGEDGGWRFEIDDSGMEIKSHITKTTPERPGFLPLQDIIKHTDLFKAYPRLKKVNVEFDLGSHVSKPGGAFIADFGTDYGHMKIEAANSKDFKETLIHEIQHAIQEIEGFGKGGSPNQMPGIEIPKGKELSVDLLKEWQKVPREARKEFEGRRPRWSSMGLGRIDPDSVEAVERMVDFAEDHGLADLKKKALDWLSKSYEFEPDKFSNYERYMNLPGERESREVARRAVRR
uniref:Putative pre-toxin TG domain contining protein n=1 Tax=viral metagenome TaxID=1070528 RepID=A0A6M3KE22_9ZZZZ